MGAIKKEQYKLNDLTIMVDNITNLFTNKNLQPYITLK